MVGQDQRRCEPRAWDTGHKPGAVNANQHPWKRAGAGAGAGGGSYNDHDDVCMARSPSH